MNKNTVLLVVFSSWLLLVVAVVLCGTLLYLKNFSWSLAESYHQIMMAVEQHAKDKLSWHRSVWSVIMGPPKYAHSSMALRDVYFSGIPFIGRMFQLVAYYDDVVQLLEYAQHMEVNVESVKVPTSLAGALSVVLGAAAVIGAAVQCYYKLLVVFELTWEDLVFLEEEPAGLRKVLSLFKPAGLHRVLSLVKLASCNKVKPHGLIKNEKLRRFTELLINEEEDLRDFIWEHLQDFVKDHLAHLVKENRFDDLIKGHVSGMIEEYITAERIQKLASFGRDVRGHPDCDISHYEFPDESWGGNLSKSSRNADAAQGYSDPDATQGYSDPAGQGYSDPDAGHGYSDPDAGEGYSDPDAGQDYSDPDAGQDYSDPDAGEGYSDPDAGHGYSDPDAGHGYSDPDAGHGYSDPDAGHGYSDPDAAQGYPDADQGYSDPGAAQGYSDPDAGHGYSDPDAGEGYSDPDAGQGYSDPDAGQDYSDPDAGQDYSDPDAGQDYSDPDAGQDYSDPDAGQDYSDPDAGQDYSDPDAGQDYSDPDAGEGYSDPDAGEGYSDFDVAQRSSDLDDSQGYSDPYASQRCSDHDVAQGFIDPDAALRCSDPDVSQNYNNSDAAQGYSDPDASQDYRMKSHLRCRVFEKNSLHTMLVEGTLQRAYHQEENFFELELERREEPYTSAEVNSVICHLAQQMNIMANLPEEWNNDRIRERLMECFDRQNSPPLRLLRFQ